MIFPGIPPTVSSPGQEPSKVIPATKSVTMGLYSDRQVPSGAYAWVTVPDGLGVGARVPLQIDRKPASAEPPKTDGNKPEQQVTQKTYWGSAEEIPQGQPRVSTSGKAAENKPAVNAALPDKSFAYWPGLRQQPLEGDATAQGAYTLDTNFAGATIATLDSDQAFLPAIQLVSDADKFDLAKRIKIEWNPVPKAVGYLVTAFGGTKDQSITWTSSLDADASVGLDERAIGAEELKSLLDKGVLLPPKATSCTIPGGIFAGATGAMISVTAFGHDKIQDANGIETRVLVRSSANVALMAKK